MRATVLCAALFGAVILAQCVPSRAESLLPVATARAVEEFRRKVPLNPPRLDGDPYAKDRSKLPSHPSGAVCALRYEADKVHYRLVTFADEAAARDAGYLVTHKGGCGTCSTLQDLATYIALPDLTAPVRSCAMRSLTHGRAVQCLEELGLSPACAETWYYNSANTRRNCFGVCLTSWLKGEPSNKPDGALNDCLQCDEDSSGGVFKVIAGRTRRNSGIRSSIDRAEAEVYPVTHDYY